MLVFDRLSTFPLTLVLLSNSPLYSLFILVDTNAYCLECLGLSLAEYARYSRLFYFLYCFAWSAAAVDVGAQEQEIPGGYYYYYYVETPFDQDQE